MRDVEGFRLLRSSCLPCQPGLLTHRLELAEEHDLSCTSKAGNEHMSLGYRPPQVRGEHRQSVKQPSEPSSRRKPG